MDRTTRKYGIVFGAVALAILLVSTSTVVAQVNSETAEAEKTTNNLLANNGEYTPRGSIWIEGNDDFITENGVTGGSGTEEDPYIIEWWELPEIKIEETTAYFVIRNCYINGAHPVRFTHVTNGVIQYSILEGTDGWGLDLKEGSCNNVVEYCTIKDHGWALTILDASNDNEIHHCTIIGKNTAFGISIMNSENNNIHHNNIYDLALGAFYTAVIHDRRKSEGLLKNQWDRNYWGNYWGLRFKILADLDRDGFGNFGHLIRSIYTNSFFPFSFEWDRHPAMQPYDL